MLRRPVERLIWGVAVVGVATLAFVLNQRLESGRTDHEKAMTTLRREASADRTRFESDLEAAHQRAVALERRVEHATRDAHVAVQELGERSAALEAATAELGAVRGDRDKFRDDAARLEAEADQLRAACSNQAELLATATRSLKKMSDAIKANRDRIAALQTDNAKLEAEASNSGSAQDTDRDKANALRAKLEEALLARTALEARAQDAASRLRRAETALKWYQDHFPGVVPEVQQPNHAGRVLAVDNTANVYVISLGSEDGVKKGFEYVVSRGASYIATIRIDDVREGQAVGHARKSLSKGDIQVGDRISSSP